MKFKAIRVANAPGPGEQLPQLPPRPAPYTVYLLPKSHPKLSEPFPTLRYDPRKATRFPERYYAPETLHPAQIGLAWYFYKYRRYRRLRWRIALLQRAPSIYYFAFDRAGRLIDYNPAFKEALRSLGRPDPIIGQPAPDIVLPENRDVFDSDLQTVLEGHAIQLQRVIGSRHAEVYITPLSKRGDAFAYYALDTTIYRQLLEAAMMQQNLHEAILQHLRDGVILLDADQKILYANAAAERILGEEAVVLVGTPCPIPLQEAISIYRNQPISTNSIPVGDERTLLIVRDLSELWEAEKRHNLLRKAIEEAPFGVLILSYTPEQCKAIYYNQTFKDWLIPDGDSLPAALRHHVSSQEWKSLLRHLRERQTFQVLLRNNHKSKNWTHLLAVFFPIDLTLPDGETELYWAVVFQNQSETYRAAQRQRRLERHQHQLILEAQEKERQYLAEELHDNLGMLLSVLKMELSTLMQDIPPSSPLRIRLQTLSTRLDEVIQHVRLTSHQLMPPLVEHFGLIPSLEGLLRRLRVTNGLITHLKVSGEEVNLPLIKRLQIYRILQELITNTLRHARAQNLHIHLTYQKRRLILEVWDDGRGYDPATTQRDGIGLRNIVGRLQVLRAHWENLSAPGQGAHYRIEVPLPRRKS
ncbi:MAG: PAS domain-containing protein [Bacteroidia bacterium]|nr:PAS domain-containing protein [Bacteroidia bacterium]